MMTMTLWWGAGAGLMALVLTTIKGKNPLKMSVMLVCSAATMMMWSFLTSQSTWVIWALYLLFMGGIMAVFMILSSLMPNKKPSKIKIAKTLAIPAVLSVMAYSQTNFQTMSDSGMKTFMSTSLNFALTASVMLAYFAAFMAILAPKKSALKSSFCLKKSIL